MLEIFSKCNSAYFLFFYSLFIYIYSSLVTVILSDKSHFAFSVLFIIFLILNKTLNQHKKMETFSRLDKMTNISGIECLSLTDFFIQFPDIDGGLTFHYREDLIC